MPIRPWTISFIKTCSTRAHHELGIQTIYAVTDSRYLPASWPGITGRITPQLIKGKLPDYRRCIFYISGPKSMVDSFKATLQQMHVHSSHIRTDFFLRSGLNISVYRNPKSPDSASNKSQTFTAKYPKRTGPGGRMFSSYGVNSVDEYFVDKFLFANRDRYMNAIQIVSVSLSFGNSTPACLPTQGIEKPLKPECSNCAGSTTIRCGRCTSLAIWSATYAVGIRPGWCDASGRPSTIALSRGVISEGV